MENTIYKEIQAFIEEHHGWSANDIADHAGYDKAMDEIKQFDGKRVKLSYITSFNQGTPKEKTGRIRLETDHRDPDFGKIKFFEGKKRAWCQYLDAGFFEGFYAVIIPIKIEVIK